MSSTHISPIGAADAGTLIPLEPPHHVGLAIYVVGAENGARVPLPKAGAVTIGRDAGCELVIAHPMISRRHATVHVGEELVLEDLRSANGTTVGQQRLEPGARRPLEVGQSFVVGSTTLVVHQHRLPTARSGWVTTPRQLLDQVAKTRASFTLIKLRLERAIEAGWIETMLAPALGADDLLVPLRAAEAAVFHPSAAADSAGALMRACQDELRRWQIASQAELGTFADAASAVGDASAFLFGAQQLRTQRGAIIVGDPAMIELHRVVERVAPTSVNVLILGETGVGKDVFASLIHERSPRSGKPLLRINCATLSEALFESELFGHEKGAFTGAIRTKVGLLEGADGGTIFFDELGEMPAPVQAKLLRVVEDGALQRVGGSKSIAVDVRFVSATNRDLEQEVQRGGFRRDLFYRLNTVQVRVPPLRERPAEILPLASHFLAEAARSFGLAQVSFSPAALDALAAYAWPGSIRQLRNVVERAALLGRGAVLEPEDLGLPRAGAPPAAAAIVPPVESMILPAALPALTAGDAPADVEASDERQRIVEALQVCHGNQSRAAVLLKMSRRTLVRKIRLFALPRPQGPFPGEKP
jgi:DNA-binding NtrC family response regulator/pSer/pThr/pTyr-binding forkhead associated (FHA) protein